MTFEPGDFQPTLFAGVQVLAAANRQALAVALAANLQVSFLNHDNVSCFASRIWLRIVYKNCSFDKKYQKFKYIRAEGFVFSHVADEGLMNACAGSLLRYRKQLGLDDRVAVFTDIKVRSFKNDP